MSVPNFRPPLHERVYFITPDGETFSLHVPPDRAVSNAEGWGHAPVNYKTTAGPYQHGESIVGSRLEPRSVTLTHRWNGCSRSEFWNHRGSILNTLRTSRTDYNNPVPGILRRIYFENGTRKIRDLDCALVAGLGFTTLPGSQLFDYQETLEFLAWNPIIYDPTLQTSTISSWTGSLILPFTFPFVLGCYYGSVNITYNGTWEELPTIEIDGPANDVYIENQDIGRGFGLDYHISTGETVTIDLSYAEKTITNNFGVNLIEHLTNDDLGEFSLQPAPLVTGGVNTIWVSLFGQTTDTEVRVKYYNRYIGI